MNKYIIYFLERGDVAFIDAEKAYEEGDGCKRVVFTINGEPVAAFPYENISGWSLWKE
jgi:hypothetical protein